MISLALGVLGAGSFRESSPQLRIQTHRNNLGCPRAQRPPSATSAKDRHVIPGFGLLGQTLNHVVRHRNPAGGPDLTILCAHDSSPVITAGGPGASASCAWRRQPDPCPSSSNSADVPGRPDRHAGPPGGQAATTVSAPTAVGGGIGSPSSRMPSRWKATASRMSATHSS